MGKIRGFYIPRVISADRADKKQLMLIDGKVMISTRMDCDRYFWFPEDYMLDDEEPYPEDEVLDLFDLFFCDEDLGPERIH